MSFRLMRSYGWGQVADAVSLTGNVDYMITDETPFAMTGSVDIVNTEHAVVIIEDILS